MLMKERFHGICMNKEINVRKNEFVWSTNTLRINFFFYELHDKNKVLIIMRLTRFEFKSHLKQ